MSSRYQNNREKLLSEFSYGTITYSQLQKNLKLLNEETGYKVETKEEPENETRDTEWLPVTCDDNRPIWKD